MHRVLILERRRALGQLVSGSLARAGFLPDAVSTAADAVHAVEARPYSAFVVDIMVDDGRAFEAVSRVREVLGVDCIIVGVSRFHPQDPAIQAARVEGVLDAYFQKPYALEDLIATLAMRLDVDIPEALDTDHDDALLKALDTDPVETRRTGFEFDEEEEEDGLAAALLTVTPQSAGPRAETGELGPSGVPELVHAFHTTGESGELLLVRGQVRKVIYFKDGVPAFAASNVRDERFDQWLLDHTDANRWELEALAAEARMNDERVDRVIARSGLFDEETFRAHVLDHSRAILFSVFPWFEGSWRMTFHGAASAEDVTLDVFPAHLILEGAAAMDAADLERLVPDDLKLGPAPDPPYELYELSLSGEQAMLLTRLDGSRSVADVIDEGWLEPAETRALLYGLLAVDVVEDASLMVL